MMIFFNGNKSHFKELLVDLEDLLNELKEIEEKQPEVDETMGHNNFKPEIDKAKKDMKVEDFNPEDIEMLVGGFSIQENDDSTSVDQSTKHSDSSSHTDNFNKVHNAKDVVNSFQCQGSNCQQTQLCQGRGGKRLNLKYSFAFNDKLEKLEQLLKSHNVSDSFLENLRKSIVSVN